METTNTHKDQPLKEFTCQLPADIVDKLHDIASVNEASIQTILKEFIQEGIKQSTLRYKTGMSKTFLSLLLKHLEEKDIIYRKEDGKTKRLYLKNKF